MHLKILILILFCGIVIHATFAQTEDYYMHTKQIRQVPSNSLGASDDYFDSPEISYRYYYYNGLKYMMVYPKSGKWEMPFVSYPESFLPDSMIKCMPIFIIDIPTKSSVGHYIKKNKMINDYSREDVNIKSGHIVTAKTKRTDTAIAIIDRLAEPCSSENAVSIPIYEPIPGKLIFYFGDSKGDHFYLFNNYEILPIPNKIKSNKKK
jgi:hypothetical protein